MGEELPGLVVAARIGEHRVLVQVLGQSAGVLEELADRDGPPVDAVAAQQSRQVRVHRLVEGDAALTGQLEHDRRGERLGVAADADGAVAGHGGTGRQIADAGGVVPCRAFGLHDVGEGGGGVAVVNHRFQLPLHGVGGAGGGCRGGAGSAEETRGDGGDRAQGGRAERGPGGHGHG